MTFTRYRLREHRYVVRGLENQKLMLGHSEGVDTIVHLGGALCNQSRSKSISGIQNPYVRSSLQKQDRGDAFLIEM